MKSLESFLSESVSVVELFNNFIFENNLADLLVVDHVCYKCESEKSFEEWRKVFEQNSKNIYQAIISKRRIAMITMAVPLISTVGEIKYLELSDQKPDNSQAEGFDHIEFFPKNKSIEELLQIFDEKNIVYEKDVKPHITQYIINAGQYNFRLAKEKVIDKIKREEFI